MLDIDRPVMRGERRHDVLPFQFPADEVFGAVKLDAAMGPDLANSGDQAACNGQKQPALAVEIGIESEVCRQVTESRLESIPENRPGSASRVRPKRGSGRASGSDNNPGNARWFGAGLGDRGSDVEEPEPALCY